MLSRQRVDDEQARRLDSDDSARREPGKGRDGGAPGLHVSHVPQAADIDDSEAVDPIDSDGEPPTIGRERPRVREASETESSRRRLE
jgi:hypothetical protein